MLLPLKLTPPPPKIRNPTLPAKLPTLSTQTFFLFHVKEQSRKFVLQDLIPTPLKLPKSSM